MACLLLKDSKLQYPLDRKQNMLTFDTWHFADLIVANLLLFIFLFNSINHYHDLWHGR